MRESIDKIDLSDESAIMQSFQANKSMKVPMNDTAAIQETVLLASNPKLAGIANMTAGAQNDTINGLLNEMNLSHQQLMEIQKIN